MVIDDVGDRGESKDRVGLVGGVNRSKKIVSGKICQTDDGATPPDDLRIINEQKLYVYIPASQIVNCGKQTTNPNKQPIQQRKFK